MISNTKLVNLRETPVSFFCIAVFLLEDPLRISALGDGLDRPRRSGNPSGGERNAYQMEIPKTVRFYLDSSIITLPVSLECLNPQVREVMKMSIFC